MEPQGSTWARLIQQKCDESLAVSAVPLAFEDTDCESKDLDECSESTPWSIGPEANDELALDKEPAEGGSPLHLATNQGEEGTFLGETQSAASSLSPRSLSSKSSKAASQSLASFVIEQKEAASIDGWSTVQSSPKRIYSKFSFDASHEDDVNNLDDDDDVSTDTERSATPRNHGHPPLQEGEIERDVPRTYPTLSLFQNARVQRRLVNALGNIALDNPDMGYVQGMNYVMAQLLLHFPQPAHAAEDTFKALIDAPAYNLRGLYSPGLHMLRSMVDRLRQLVRKLRPGLFARLQALDLDSLHFTFNWFITLFSYTMPFEVLADVWGLFFEQSWAAIFRVSLVLLATVEVDLLRADFETATLILRAAPTFPRKDLINQARRVPLTPHDERDIRDLVFMDCV
ncbi:TBC1 domain family member 10A [Hondaea fermentalgiana]|uniref:TBC1 domain family member 10A n=1 Tax=Hondaea fermentalgiana TaxID=2315210 RepID=A0A2R5GXM7_9STRA|nr:TBC1 domain family member 10A [Hondaea fermentalgiana]|eukprot:GBG33171.1 TBC1 domain family member 10A [Hondaea fermentalgiana]